MYVRTIHSYKCKLKNNELYETLKEGIKRNVQKVHLQVPLDFFCVQLLPVSFTPIVGTTFLFIYCNIGYTVLILVLQKSSEILQNNF